MYDTQSSSDGSESSEEVHATSDSEDNDDEDYTPSTSVQNPDENNNDDLQLPQQLQASSLKGSIGYTDPFTKTQRTVNELLCSVSDTSLEKAASTYFQVLTAIASEVYTKPGDAKQINSVVTKFTHHYRNSDDFYSTLKTLFHAQTLETHHISLGVALMLRVQDYFFHQSSHTTQQNIVSQTHNYDQHPAKIRYIAGMCVGRALASSISYVCQHCHDESALVNEHKQRVRSLQGSLYNTLTIAKEETVHPVSLLEIEHRQFKYGHLTIVNDDLFSIFIQYDKIVHQNISTKWSAEDKHNFFNTVFHSCVTELYQDTSPILEVLNSKVMRPPLLTYLRTCYKK